MTILPKKKISKDKNDPENNEHHHSHGHSGGHSHPSHGHALSLQHVHGHYHHPSTVETRLDKSVRGRSSPTRWGPSTSREEKLHSAPTPFDFDSHDASGNHKRRHRPSPHRTVRKHRSGHSSHSSSGQPSPETGVYDIEEDRYNSEDEHVASTDNPVSEELDEWFEQTLKEKKGFIIRKMGEDGACLFRAVADQVYGDQEMNSTVRNMCIDYMAKNAEFFSQYVTEGFDTYLTRKRMDHCHGNHLEIQAMAELYNRPVEVYQYSLDPINTFHSTYKTDNDPIRISYHQNVHYNSVVDPCKATVGVGLGLPGYQPGLADRTLMEKAVKKSEDHHLEQAMLEDKMRETDWELTDDSLQEQVARQSYLQWIRDQDAGKQRRSHHRSATATCSSSAGETGVGSPEAWPCRSSPRNCSGQNNPQQPIAMDLPVAGSSQSPRSSPREGTSDVAAMSASGCELGAVAEFRETSSVMDNLPAELCGWGVEEEDHLIAHVLALSQQEYLQSLEQIASSSSSQSMANATATVISKDCMVEQDGVGCRLNRDSYRRPCDS